MPARLPLTDEQLVAAYATTSRLHIEAAPGSGKTTVAAERFGALRYWHRGDGRATLALSFTRAAAGELGRRIRARWGSSSLATPHAILTLDSLHDGLVHRLLRRGDIAWPGGLTKLNVIDTWDGHKGYRPLEPRNFRQRIVTLRDRVVVTNSAGIREPVMGFGSGTDLDGHLAAGLCTHNDLRRVLAIALDDPALRTLLRRDLHETVRAMIVDEVFDADELDLAVVMLACEADCDVTLVGDPWQALYGFRGARPELVDPLRTSYGFNTATVSKSFRFDTDEMTRLATAIQSGGPVTLPAPGDHPLSVVLAKSWSQLWAATEYVLPVSFGSSRNATVAAMTILLAHIVPKFFPGERVPFVKESRTVLRLPVDGDPHREDALDGVVATLVSDEADAPDLALQQLRKVIDDLGGRQIRRLRPVDEQKRIDQLAALRQRLRCDRPLVCGLTVHQAKGREWQHVGVVLTDTQVAVLLTGLQKTVDEDRLVFVALTRGRCCTRAL